MYFVLDNKNKILTRVWQDYLKLIFGQTEVAKKNKTDTYDHFNVQFLRIKG